MPTEDDVTYGFNREQAFELVRGLGQRDFSVKLYEAESLGGREGVYLVATGSGIPARSGTTAGSATVTVQEIVGATITPTSKTITAYNISAVAIPADCYTVVREDRFGDFIADPPAVTDLRLDGLNFQLRRNCDWSTWLTGAPCDE